MAQNNHLPIDTSFLQVTINSNKLMSMLDSMVKQISQHSADLRMLKDVIPTIKNSVQNNLQMTEMRIQLQSQRMQQRVKAQLGIQESQLKQLSEIVEKNHNNLATQLKTDQQALRRIQQDKKRVDAHIKSFQQKISQKQAKDQEEYNEIQARIEETKEMMAQSEKKFEDQFQMVLIKVQSLLSNSKGPTKVDPPFRTGEIKRVTPSTATNWAQFSHKINQLEKKIQSDKQTNEYSNKVIYANRSQMMIKDRKDNPNFSTIHQCEEERSPEISNCLNSIIKHISSYREQIDALKSKCLVLDEKNNINLRKIQKQSQKIVQMRASMKKQEERKSEDQLIDILRNQFRSKTHEIDEQLDRKVYKDQYEKQRAKIHEKIIILQENLVDKAEKGEMKKAFLFLEDKIKQIIILMAGEQGQEKDGAIRKIPMKCLSCDKHIENEGISTSRPPSPMREKENVLSRSMSRNIRKRFHITNLG